MTCREQSFLLGLTGRARMSAGRRTKQLETSSFHARAARVSGTAHLGRAVVAVEFHIAHIISVIPSVRPCQSCCRHASRVDKVGGTFFDACVGIIAGPIVVYLAFEVAQMGTSTVPNLC